MPKPISSALAITRAVLTLAVAASAGLAHAISSNPAETSRPMTYGHVFEAGHPSLAEWQLPEVIYPAENEPTAARVELGKMLFFDPRVGGDGNMSCASCHNPLLGWSDGLPTARGHRGARLRRATPSIVNTAYNAIQMWDGREATLEDQASGPMQAGVQMNTDVGALVAWLNADPGYRSAFDDAYPGAPVDLERVSMAIASFERTVISNDSPFDRWLAGDEGAMSEQQVRGLQLFVGHDKGNCAVCHAAPNFTDDGFHNLGLTSSGLPNADPGRFAEQPVGPLYGAFKTPTLRDVALTAPYFHDGSAATLADVVEHYARGGNVKANLSPEIKALDLTEQEKADIVAFMHALTSPPKAFVLPRLPASERPARRLAGTDPVEEVSSR